MPLQRMRILYMSVWDFFTRIVDLLGLFLAMYLSELLVDNIIFGGALYIAGEVWVTYARIYGKQSFGLLPRSIRNRGLGIFVLSGFLTAALVVFFPYLQSKVTSVVLVLLIAGFILQQIVTDLTARKLDHARRARRAGILLGVHIVFLAAYLVIFYLNQLLLQYPIPAEIGVLYLAVILCSLFLYACQLLDPPEPEDALPAPAEESVNADAMLDVHSYRVYNRMTVNVFLAINLCITGFICYMRFLPYTGFLNSLVMLVLWILFIALFTAFGFALLGRRYLAKYDRPAIIGVGLLFWVVAAFTTVQDVWNGSTIGSVLSAAFMGISLACMLSVILQQSYEMKTVIELGVGKIDNGAYERNTGVMIDWSTLISYLLMLFMLTISAFIMDGRIDQIEAMKGMQRVFRAIMLVLPMFFVLAALIYSLLQPLDRNYAEKLRKYTHQQQAGEENPPLEARLKKMLVTNYPRKLAVKILKPIARPFLPCKVSGAENVDLSSGPVVFVCNHLELYGPIIAVLHSPFYFRPWVIQSMLDKDIIADHMKSGADKTLGFIPSKLRYRLIRLVSPLVIWIMQSTDPIPVYRGTVRGVIQTIQLSVEAMEYDDNILLFPEINYQEEGVGDFFTGFVQVAKTYYRQTGRCTTFYPMYIDKKSRRMTYGEGVTFNPENTPGTEKERIVDLLQERMNGMASRDRA